MSGVHHYFKLCLPFCLLELATALPPLGSLVSVNLANSASQVTSLRSKSFEYIKASYFKTLLLGTESKPNINTVNVTKEVFIANICLKNFIISIDNNFDY